MTAPIPPASMPPERAGTDLQRSIVVVATNLFAEQGYAGTSMREVALAADCTKPALYYYFQNKEALFLDVIRTQTEAIGVILETSFATPGTVRERLIRGAKSYLDFVREEPTAIKVLWRAEMRRESGQPEVDWESTRAAYGAQVAALLEEGVANGEIAASVDLEDAYHILAGAVDIRCTLWILQRVPIPDDCATRTINMLFEGISS